MKPILPPLAQRPQLRSWTGLGQVLLAVVGIAPTAQAQFLPDYQEQRKPALGPPDQYPTRLGLRIRFGFNISATFENRGGSVSNPGPASGSGFDHFYDDGFVRPDETFPNNAGLTFNWGYDNASQVGANDIFFHSAGAASGGGTGGSIDNVPVGLEFTLARDLGATGSGRWGVEAGFAFTDLAIRDRGTTSGQANLLTDAYSLGTPPIIPPVPPFAGSFNGVNLPVIADSPNSRTVASTPVTVSGQRDVVASLYTFRVGPYFVFPLSPRTDAQFGVGLATALVDSRFSFNETTVSAASGSVTRSGRTEDTDILLGAYLNGQLSARLTERITLFGGAQFETLSDFAQDAGSKRARVDFGQAIYVFGGASYSF